MPDPLPCILKRVLLLMLSLEGKEKKASAERQGQGQQLRTNVWSAATPDSVGGGPWYRECT